METNIYDLQEKMTEVFRMASKLEAIEQAVSSIPKDKMDIILADLIESAEGRLLANALGDLLPGYMDALKRKVAALNK
jgi:hypothetical protein